MQSMAMIVQSTAFRSCSCCLSCLKQRPFLLPGVALASEPYQHAINQVSRGLTAAAPCGESLLQQL